MNKIKIVVDSTADLTKEEIEKYNLEVLPLTVNVDGEEFEDISNEDYILKMRTAKSFFTSQPAIGKIMDKYKQLTDEGYDIISIHLSDVISGTFNTASHVAKSFTNVKVVNSKTTSRGMVFLIKECINQISLGKNISEISEILNNKAKKILTYVTIDRLDNLVKGGRLKKASGIIGGFLNIKILTKLYTNELKMIKTVRGKKKLVSALIENVKKDAGEKIKSIKLAHALSYEYIEMIKVALFENLGYKLTDNDVFITCPVISTHTGEGAVGIIIELE